MICRNCKSDNTYVIDSRQDKDSRYRRYKCRNCNHRFTTKEIFKEDIDRTREVYRDVLGFIGRFTANASGTGYRKEVIEAFTQGGCYWFAFVLSSRFSREGVPTEIVVDYVAAHFGCRIGKEVYDITGVVTDQYEWERWSDCKDVLLKQRIEEYCIMF